MLPGEISRFSLYFVVEFSTAAEKVVDETMAALESLVDGDKCILAEPRYKARVNRATSRGIEYEVRYFIVPRNISPSKARHRVNAAIVEYLNRVNIQLSYPKSEIYRISTDGMATIEEKAGDGIILDDDPDAG
jgi:small-conductance mechanosensitive channel